MIEYKSKWQEAQRDLQNQLAAAKKVIVLIYSMVILDCSLKKHRYHCVAALYKQSSVHCIFRRALQKINAQIGCLLPQFS